MRHRKSQMEIMGLAIVVVLIVMGMLFSIKFVLFKEDKTYRKDYLNTQLAANTLNTLLNTNTNCNGISISELLQDASKDYHSLNCPGYLNSQEYANLTINYLINKTISSIWVKDYYFEASVSGSIIANAGEEFVNRERERKTHFLQTDAGVMSIIFDIYG